MTIVGVDISTTQIHTAWIDGTGSPRRWHCTLGKPTTPIQDRVRNIHMQWPPTVTEICIEYPFGRSRTGLASMMAVVGAVTKSAPSYCRVAWISSGDLRQAIGAANTKASAHGRIGWLYPGSLNGCFDWDEHELDALVACIGWTRILAAQDAA